jgi:phosphate/sulfate permease
VANTLSTDIYQAIFSMSFFNFTPKSNNEPGRWTMSEKFWVYWVVAVPLTAIAVGCWLAWQRIYTSKAKAQWQ